MKLKSNIFLASLCVLFGMYGTQLAAAVLSTNFSDAINFPPGDYTNGTSISTGTLNLNVYINSGASTFSARGASSPYSSTNTIQLIDNSSTAATSGIYSDISSLYSSGAGYLSGSYSFLSPSISSGSKSGFVFAISNAINIGSTVSAVQLTINSSMNLIYYAGSTYTVALDSYGNNIVLNTNSLYTMTWWADLSSLSKDSYGFVLKDSSEGVIFNSGTLSTRADNISTSSLYMLLVGNTEASKASSDPFIEINDVSIANVIPEPSIIMMFISGIFLLVFWKRKAVFNY